MVYIIDLYYCPIWTRLMNLETLDLTFEKSKEKQQLGFAAQDQIITL